MRRPSSIQLWRPHAYMVFNKPYVYVVHLDGAGQVIAAQEARLPEWQLHTTDVTIPGQPSYPKVWVLTPTDLSSDEAFAVVQLFRGECFINEKAWRLPKLRPGHILPAGGGLALARQFAFFP